MKDKADLQITSEQIDRCHRVGRRVSNKSRPVIIKFTSYKYKEFVFKNKRSFQNTKISVQENLTKTRLEVYKAACVQFGRQCVWTVDGMVKAKTVLHWGAKHGNANIIKLFAGKHKADVTARTGYTPLHMAIQFNHKDVFNLLVDVYNANPNIRDFSGRKPLQYESTQTQAAHKDSYKIKSRKKLADKDLRFLRIGSLNVKVKKTTEAFSNFLGVGSGSTINPADNLSEKVHKSWGSVDNLSQENLMPAPKGYVGKKKSKKMDNSGANSIPWTPSEIPRPFSHRNSMQDSDSDSAAGFDSQWQH